MKYICVSLVSVLCDWQTDKSLDLGKRLQTSLMILKYRNWQTSNLFVYYAAVLSHYGCRKHAITGNPVKIIRFLILLVLYPEGSFFETRGLKSEGGLISTPNWRSDALRLSRVWSLVIEPMMHSGKKNQT